MGLFWWILLLSILFQDCLGTYVWKIVPRLLDGGIAEVPVQSYNGSTTSLCALECQMKPSCQLFRYNANTLECDLYDGRRFKRISNIHRNQFYQKMPEYCVTGLDEWFPEYQTCIWIPSQVYPYEEAKSLCESAGKIMLGINNFSQVLDLMDLLNTNGGHVTPSIGLLSAEVSNRKARVEHMKRVYA